MEKETNITLQVDVIQNNGISIKVDWSKKNLSTNSLLRMENAFIDENNQIKLDSSLIRILEEFYFIEPNCILDCLLNSKSYNIKPIDGWNEKCKNFSNWNYRIFLANTRNNLLLKLKNPNSMKNLSDLIDFMDNKYNFKDWIIHHRVEFNDYVILNEKDDIYNGRGYSKKEAIKNIIPNSRIVKVL
ncbi:hypothetical protein CP985_14235 [Malaciobacter mytili LMG 24559]|uniref:Uncharacterized protein n=1 Tax=Malaciobacter mytili LMG 24559 TaxID=1032238 RepID=A0AAX2AE88_9BACT|nr:hypothetical protein [Malaciobacter mytili]AXH16330.1 hypothetical protein AMYT_a0030 [Malaciobacter mytili LMG 24559]RXK12872.1 hypothetical protein CP985_14235 [Malaciobacter mytili LMG 24559]